MIVSIQIRKGSSNTMWYICQAKFIGFLFLDYLGKCGGVLGVSGQKTIYHGTEIL